MKSKVLKDLATIGISEYRGSPYRSQFVHNLNVTMRLERPRLRVGCARSEQLYLLLYLAQFPHSMWLGALLCSRM
jgi:hypothetical protein